MTTIERMSKSVPISLVFLDWQDRFGKSISDTEEGFELSCGNLHAGTTFKGTIEVSEDTALDLKYAFEKGCHPVFYLVEVE